MDPLEFHGSKVLEDPTEFIDELYKLLMIMRVTLVEKVELVPYKLKGVAKILFSQWKEGKMEYTLIEKNLKWYFLKDYFPFIFRRKRCSKLNNLFQGNMSFREYASNFTQLSWDVSSIVIYPRVCMNKLM